MIQAEALALSQAKDSCVQETAIGGGVSGMSRMSGGSPSLSSHAVSCSRESMHICTLVLRLPSLERHLGDAGSESTVSVGAVQRLCRAELDGSGLAWRRNFLMHAYHSQATPA